MASEGFAGMNKRTTIAVAAAALLLLLMAAPVGAAHTYVGFSTGTALEFTITPPDSDPTGLVVGFSDAAVQSGPSEDGCTQGNACAEGAGELLFGDSATATAPGDPGPHEVTAFELPEALDDILIADIGIGRAQASSGADTSAHGEGGAATLSITVTETVLGSDAGEPIEDTLQDLSDTLLGPLEDNETTEQLGEQVKGLFDLLIENLANAPLADIAVGASSAEADDVSGITTASAEAQGAQVLVAPFPNPLPGVPALVIIDVGAASVSVSSDQFDATADADPAIVRLRVFDPAQALETPDDPYQEVEVALGEEETCAGASPLIVCIAPSAESTEITGSGATAIATAVGVSLFEDPLPTVRLRLAETEAGVNSAPPPAEPTAPPAPSDPTPQPDLPRTGGGMALPALALLGLGGAGWFGLRRMHG